jgi:hypothetical protein
MHTQESTRCTQLWSHNNPLLTLQVLIFKKLGWGDLWRASKSCRSKLSVTGDMAKYIVFNPLQRWCTFPTRLSQPLLRWCSFCSNGQVKTKTRLFRSNPSDQPGRVPSYNSLPPSVHLVEFSQLSWSRQSPYDSWLHWKLHDLNVSNLFVPGWLSTSEIHTTAIEMAPV